MSEHLQREFFGLGVGSVVSPLLADFQAVLFFTSLLLPLLMF